MPSQVLNPLIQKKPIYLTLVQYLAQIGIIV